ncbi:protein of unknown function [Methylocaldum szegediense]|uniref:Uncharacterized protein n=1 Tax=Methylocaldum szegediense TaxID=73780 RepID=A0ABM9I5Z9_9GAMM|nr:protein of unknown function [Methylocaldum szegediense]
MRSRRRAVLIRRMLPPSGTVERDGIIFLLFFMVVSHAVGAASFRGAIDIENYIKIVGNFAQGELFA